MNDVSLLGSNSAMLDSIFCPYNITAFISLFHFLCFTYPSLAIDFPYSFDGYLGYPLRLSSFLFFNVLRRVNFVLVFAAFFFFLGAFCSYGALFF